MGMIPPRLFVPGITFGNTSCAQNCFFLFLPFYDPKLMMMMMTMMRMMMKRDDDDDDDDEER